MAATPAHSIALAAGGSAGLERSWHGFFPRARVVGAAAADGRGWGGSGSGGPFLPRDARRRGAPLGRGAAPAKGPRGACPVCGARWARRQRRGGQDRGTEEEEEEEAGARATGVEADPVRLEEDTKHHHPQRPHGHLWCANVLNLSHSLSQPLQLVLHVQLLGLKLYFA